MLAVSLRIALKLRPDMTSRFTAIFLSLACVMLVACGGDADPATLDERNPEAGSAPFGKTSDAVAAQQAVATLTAAIEASPTDPELYARRGEVYYTSDVYDRAAADLRASLKLDSTNPAVWHLLADAQLDGLRSREALNTMIYASARFKERMGTQLKLAEYQYLLQQYDDALVTLDRAASIDENEPEVYFMLGQVFSESGDTLRAVNAYTRATELNADLLDAWLSLGILHEAQGRAVAERYFDAAIAVDRDNAVPYRMRADYLARQDRLAEAVAGYDEAIARDPRLAEAFFNSGLVLIDMDSLSRAAGQFDRATALRPTYAEAHYFRGVASELQGNLQDAQQRYQQALNIQPQYEQARYALEQLHPNDSQ